MRSKTVGLRELKNRLSEYIRKVRAGQGFLVTDRGEIVAELRPPDVPGGAREVHPGLRALAQRGSLRLGAPNDPALYPPLPQTVPSAAAQRLLDAERGDR